MMPQWRLERAQVAITVQIAGAYTAGDVVGGRLTIPLGGGVRGGGFINRVQLVDKDNEKAEMTFHFFDTLPTAIADADAYAPAEAEAVYHLGSVLLPATKYTSYTSNAFAIGRVSGKDQVDGEYISWEYAASGSIYCYMVCTATPTYTAATDLILIVEMYLP